MALPAVDCDKAFAMQLMLEDTLLTTQTVYFQVALLYPAPCYIIYMSIFHQIKSYCACVPCHDLEAWSCCFSGEGISFTKLRIWVKLL